MKSKSKVCKPVEKPIKLRLVLDIDYIPNGVTKAYLEYMLKKMIDHTAGEGLMTLDTPAEVETWHVAVEDRQ